MRRLFSDFLAGTDSLRVYYDRKLLFASGRSGLLPLLDYLRQSNYFSPGVIIFDKVVGNAAALLAAEAGCKKILSPLGSQQSIITLERYKIKYRFIEIVPYIYDITGRFMCPMERLSLNKKPEEFYRVVSSLVSNPS